MTSMRVSKNIILASTSLLIIIISLSSKQHMVVGQYQTVGMYYSENLAAGQIYQWNVTDFQINDTIWTLHNTDFQLGSNITIEITTDDIGQKNYFNSTSLTPIDDIDHTKLMNIFIDNTPIPLDRFDNDYLLMNIEIIEYGWVSDPAFHYYPNLHFFTTVHRHLDDDSIVDSLSWLWYISNFTLNGNELTIYYNNQGTKGGYSYRENQIWKYNLDYGVTTEFSDNYTITSPVEATGAVFSYKFELMTELTEPIINTNISSSNTISDSDPTTSSITSSTTTSVTQISTNSSMSNSESISISDSQSTSQEPVSGTSTSSASPLIMSETLIVMGIIIVNQKYKSRTK